MKRRTNIDKNLDRAWEKLKAERDTLYLENRRLKRRARKLLKGDDDALYFMGLAPEPKAPPPEEA